MNSPQGEPRQPQKSRESFSAQQIQLTPLIPSLSLSSEKAPQLKDTKHVYELISKQIAWIQKTTNRASTQYETEFSFDSLSVQKKAEANHTLQVDGVVLEHPVPCRLRCEPWAKKLENAKMSNILALKSCDFPCLTNLVSSP